MAEEEKEEEPKKGGLMRIIMLALGAIALIGIGVGAGYFLFGGKPADPSTEIEEIIERSRAGSSTFRPPTKFTNTSFDPIASPILFSRTAINIPNRL